jgi:hypothetical protein
LGSGLQFRFRKVRSFIGFVGELFRNLLAPNPTTELTGYPGMLVADA